MTPRELFNELENTENQYSYFKKGRTYVQFSTGGWSENEGLIEKLKKELCFKILLFRWQAGGHYTFEIPEKEMMDYDFK